MVLDDGISRYYHLHIKTLFEKVEYLNFSCIHSKSVTYCNVG